MNSEDDIRKMTGLVIEMADKIRGRAAYSTMALGFLLTFTAMSMVAALIEGQWNPAWALATGVIVSVLGTAATLCLGGLFVAASESRLADSIRADADLRATERVKLQAEVDVATAEVDAAKAEVDRLKQLNEAKRLENAQPGGST